MTKAASESSSTLFTSYKLTSRFGSLNGLRFLCIFAVLWHHSPALEFTPDLPIILKRGFVGVDFFFVLSGFLITTLLLREEAAKGCFSLLDFYWRRLLRIVPVYFFVVTAVASYYVLYKGVEEYAPLVPYYYLFLSNFLTADIPTLGPLWSLAVEEQYYVVWPLLLLLVPRRLILSTLVVLIVINVVGAMGWLAYIGIHAIDTAYLHIAAPHATYAPILLGSGVAVLLHHERGFAVLSRLLGHTLMPVVTFALLLVLLQLSPPDLRGLPNLAIHLVMSACLITLVVREDNILAPALSWRPIARVGEISYGVYLYHLIALHITGILLAPVGLGSPWVLLVAYCLMSILMAEISFRTLEGYFRQFKHRRPGARKTV